MEKLIRNRKVVSIILLIISFWMLFTNLFSRNESLVDLANQFDIFESQKINVLFFKELFEKMKTISDWLSIFGVKESVINLLNIWDVLLSITFYLTIGFFIYTILSHLMNRKSRGIGYLVCVGILMFLMSAPFLYLRSLNWMLSEAINLNPSLNLFICLGTGIFSCYIYKKDGTKIELIFSDFINLDSFFDGKTSPFMGVFKDSKETEWICPKCGNENESESKYCAFCGGEKPKRVNMYCPFCGSEVTEGSKFCGNCGKDLGDLTPSENLSRSIEREHKKLTIFSKQTTDGLKQKFEAIKDNQEKYLKVAKIGIPVVCVVVIFGLILNKVIIPTYQTNKRIEKIKTANVGDVITFGNYEQDNNSSNGKEEIEWIALDKTEDKILVISKYGLDAQPYHQEEKNVTWETCDLRKWLNNTFVNEAFTEEEKSKIVTTNVTADKNPEWNTYAGNDTQDKVFLLSINEAKRYFSSDEARICALTEYAIEQGAYKDNNYTVDGMGICWWWLRSAGNNQDYAAGVYGINGIGTYGDLVNIDYLSVRPALWIDLKS